MTTYKAQKCMQPGCLTNVSSGHLMCVSHWLRVPGGVRREVQRRMIGWKNRGAARQYLFDWLRQQKG